MKCINTLAFVLVVVGALNWGLWGFFQFDLVAWIFNGNTTWISRFIYAIIGLSGVLTLRMIPHAKHLCCSSKSCKK